MDPPFDGTPLNGKRKRGKAMSVTPSVDEEEPEDRDAVSILFVLGWFCVADGGWGTETPEDEGRGDPSCDEGEDEEGVQ